MDMHRNAQGTQTYTFGGPLWVENPRPHRRNMKNRPKIIKNEMLHQNVFMDVCGKYRAKAGQTSKNLCGASTFDPPIFQVGCINP